MECDVTVSATATGPGPFWSVGFRPFFLLAGLWAPLALGLWISLFVTGAKLPSRFDPLTWHIHEMLFGFVLAAAAGFMLTAIATWTGRRPVHGATLKSLVVIWLLGRIACLVSARLPLWLAATVDLAFPVTLCAVAAREIIAARNWRNVMMPVPFAVMGIADLLMHLDVTGRAPAVGLGWRLALAAVVALLSAVGGRIVPAFSRNWLVGRGATVPPVEPKVLSRAALATLHAGLVAWAFFPAAPAVAVTLVIAAILNLWRLAGWRGWLTRSEPLLFVLHLGYAWVVLGAGLLGLSMLTAAAPISAAIHALTAGAIGTMVLAVMTRVTRGHTGRPLQADRGTTAIYALITLAGLIRVGAALGGAYSVVLMEAAATLWILAFLLFVVAYGPMLVRPRIDAVSG
ncbi:MAG: NnrS family protein [Proteobacteria bacterium]|nr:NnrS family protein [Pseudomonadota bacterium]